MINFTPSRPAATAARGARVDAVLAQIEELKPALAANARQGDIDRRVVEASIIALRKAGAFRVGVPRRFGGIEGTIRNQLEVSAAIAEADGGAAWVTTLFNVGAYLVCTGNEQLQRDIFGADPDATTGGVITPSCKATPTDGGYLVNGKSYYASGSLHATWGGSGALILDSAGKIVDQALVFAPMSKIRVEDTWFVAGMRASGSNALVWENVFVPTHRVISVGPPSTGVFDTPFVDEELYRTGFTSTFVVVLVGPQLGLGRAALDLVLGAAAKKNIAYTVFDHQTDSVAFQVRVAKAATDVETAHLLAFTAADLLDGWATEGHFPTMEERARVRSLTVAANERINAAINDLLTAAGASAFAESNPLQRIWRDSNVAARHAVMLPDVGYESYGKALLGIKEYITPLL